MDLLAEAQRLRLDLLAVAASRALDGAGVPHVLLKGPTTATWLYDDPRPYRDVDLLVPTGRAERAAEVLAAADVARPAGGRLGEEAEHSRLLVSPHGDEIDLHVALPGTAPDGDRLWTALEAHVEPFDLADAGTLPALDPAGRCLVVALHALAAGPYETTPADDLRRARATATPEQWTAARALAAGLGLGPLWAAATGDPAGHDAHPAARRAALLNDDSAPPAARGLLRIAEAPRRRRPALVWAELVPSRGFMEHLDPTAARSRGALARAHLRRWVALGRTLVPAARAFARARRSGR